MKEKKVISNLLETFPINFGLEFWYDDLYDVFTIPLKIKVQLV